MDWRFLSNPWFKPLFLRVHFSPLQVEAERVLKCKFDIWGGLSKPIERSRNLEAKFQGSSKHIQALSSREPAASSKSAAAAAASPGSRMQPSNLLALALVEHPSPKG